MSGRPGRSTAGRRPEKKPPALADGTPAAQNPNHTPPAAGAGPSNITPRLDTPRFRTPGGDNMPFDLMIHAKMHRCHLRNLHDGRPVPPARIRGGKRGPASGDGYAREEAIVGRHGYMTADGDRIGWALLCGTKHMFNPRLRDIRAIPGVVVRQEGDTEAAGSAPIEAVGRLLDVLKVWRLRMPTSAGASSEHMRRIRPVRSFLI